MYEGGRWPDAEVACGLSQGRRGGVEGDKRFNCLIKIH